MTDDNTSKLDAQRAEALAEVPNLEFAPRPAIQGWADRVSLVAGWIAGAALMAMASVQAWQVFARYVLNASPDWTEPVALLLLITAMMFGAAVGVRAESHFGFFIARQAAPPRIAYAMQAFSRLVIAMVGVLLAYWGAWLAQDSWEVPMAGAGIPEGSIFIPLSIGGALIALFALNHLWVAARVAPALES